ncbi:hypothetical protein [Glycomyces sp. NPDC048151]|uniref:hypothetical protein n=1 Tax=Glycomyces sp. NPDC048151 TaxID=3364002 RepID=UPI00371B41A2
MSWRFIVRVTDCVGGSPISGATVHVKGYYEYEDQTPEVSYTAIADGGGRLIVEPADNIDDVRLLIGQGGYAAQLLQVSSDQAGQEIGVCLQRAEASAPTQPPSGLHVTGWGDDHVDVEWWNGQTYGEVFVGWTNVTLEPGAHHQLKQAGGSTSGAIRTRIAVGHVFDLKVKGYGSAHGWSPWTVIRWQRPAPAPAPMPIAPAPAPAPMGSSTQEGWRWCRNCQALIFTDGTGHDPAASVLGLVPACTAGGVHNGNGSGRYQAFHGYMAAATAARTQGGWSWCKRCNCLVYSGFGEGICHDGAAHDLSASGRYFLYYEVGQPQGTQNGWRWCNRCQVLAYGGTGNGGGGGVCHDGSSHDFQGSGDYAINHTS